MNGCDCVVKTNSRRLQFPINPNIGAIYFTCVNQLLYKLVSKKVIKIFIK